MFDIGFSELVLCFFVALVVLGPQRLPVVARAVGRWTGMAKGYLRNLSSELERETNASELKRQLTEARQALSEQSKSLEDAARKTVDDTKPTL